MPTTTNQEDQEDRKEESVTAPRQIIEVYGENVDFPDGEVQRVRNIAEYTIVEYVRHVTGDVALGKPSRCFCVYVKTEMVCDAESGEGIDYDSVDEALVAAIAFKYQDVSSEAPFYFMRMIGAVIQT